MRGVQAYGGRRVGVRRLGTGAVDVTGRAYARLRAGERRYDAVKELADLEKGLTNGCVERCGMIVGTSINGLCKAVGQGKRFPFV